MRWRMLYLGPAAVDFDAHFALTIMGHVATNSVDTVYSTLSMESAGVISNAYKAYDTDNLVDQALNSIIEKITSTEPLHGSILPKDLLRHMLLEAPTNAGRRYMALALHVAASKGSADVIHLASVLLDNLLFPMLTLMSNDARAVPSSSHSPTLDQTAIAIEPADRSQQDRLRNLLLTREEKRCAITGFVLASRALELRQTGQTVPGVTHLEAAHIVPLALNSFDEPSLWQAATTWDILQNWTSVDLRSLVGENINTPRNAILINRHDHREFFGKFKIWFEEIPGEANRYMVKTARNAILSNGKYDAIAQFPSKQQSGIDPPDPELLRIHAAFAKVLHACGAADVYAKWEEDLERRGVVEDKDSIRWLDARLNAITVN